MGCVSINFNPRVDKKLDTEYLNEKLETEKIDLSINGMCPGTLPLKVVNVETRDKRYVIYDVMGSTWYLIPNGFTDHVARYIEEKLIESKLTIDKESGKEIDVSIEEVKAELARLDEQIEIAELTHDEGSKERAQEEKIELTEALNAVMGRGNRPRKLKDPQSGARLRVGRALNLAFKELKDICEPAHDHLKEAIGRPYATALGYKPKSPVTWIT